MSELQFTDQDVENAMCIAKGVRTASTEHAHFKSGHILHLLLSNPGDYPNQDIYAEVDLYKGLQDLLLMKRYSPAMDELFADIREDVMNGVKASETILPRLKNWSTLSEKKRIDVCVEFAGIASGAIRKFVPQGKQSGITISPLKYEGDLTVTDAILGQDFPTPLTEVQNPFSIPYTIAIHPKAIEFNHGPKVLSSIFGSTVGFVEDGFYHNKTDNGFTRLAKDIELIRASRDNDVTIDLVYRRAYDSHFSQAMGKKQASFLETELKRAVSNTAPAAATNDTGRGFFRTLQVLALNLRS